MLPSQAGAIDLTRLRSRSICDALRLPIDPDYRRRERLTRIFRGETTAYAALTFGDLVYDWVRIKPYVLEAVDFARIGDLADIFAFARYSAGIQDLSQATYDGNISQLQGYVAERIAAGLLRAQGAEVEIPATSNQPGYDLIVNGQECQVKCLDDPSGVYAHLGQYPDIPVLVNEELAERFADDDRIIALPGLKHDQVHETTESSLEAGTDLLDLEIPVISTTLQAARNAVALVRNQTDWHAALENFGIDSITRVFMGKMGVVAAAASLSVIGITGGWIAVVAPMVGAIGGYKVGVIASDSIKKIMFCREESDELTAALHGYTAAAIDVLRIMIAQAERQAAQLGVRCRESNAAGLELIEDWRGRIEDENSFRRAMIREFETCASQLDRQWLTGPNLLAIAGQVSLITARAGLVPVNLATETRRLAHAAEAYRAALGKRLLSAKVGTG